jgi:D-alanyl-D-alanine carboxypeptidase
MMERTDRMELTRMAASRALRLIAFLSAGLAGGSALADSPALVVEVESGRVLHAERATDPWYPASITKLMTAYVALDEVRRGRASMEQLLTVTDSAAALPPSKMAFKPGTQIRLDNALKIIMVKSANDVAATIAENLGGSVEGFAGLMNAAAARLGMRESHFVNPHGLPDERQQTSARDMAILARALLREFPEQDDLFNIGAIQFGRRIMRNHNGLVGRYPGADGMKTGFICASGFNVVASAERSGRRLITVVLGSSSANERTLKAADLFDRGFTAQSTFFSPLLTSLQASVLPSPPNMRAIICDRRGPMPGEEDGAGTVNASVDSGIPNLLSSNVLAYAGGSLQPTRTTLGPRAPVQPVRVWIGANPPSETELAAQAAEEAAEEQARLAKRAKKTIAKKSDPAAKAGAESRLAVPAAILDEGKNGRQSLSIKPVSGGAPEKAAKPIPARSDARPAAPAKAEPKKDIKADVQPKATSKPKGEAKTTAKSKPDAKAEAKVQSGTKTN